VRVKSFKCDAGAFLCCMCHFGEMSLCYIYFFGWRSKLRKWSGMSLNVAIIT
jgi:hypothetical protein